MSRKRAASGDCYQAAVETASRLRPGYSTGERAQAEEVLAALGGADAVVHGVVTGSGPPVQGTRFGHAWVEARGLVFDLSNGQCVVAARDRYYEAGQINEEECQRYPPIEALRRVHETNHWGPW